MKAKLIVEKLPNFAGHANLYELDEEVFFDCNKQRTKFVVVSAIIACPGGPETYIFPADSVGKVLNWVELDGSFRGAEDHNQALRNMGCEEII